MNPNSYTYNRNSQNNAFTFDTIIIAHTYTYPKDTPYWNESGNRTRKTAYRSHDTDPEPLPEKTEDLPNGWDILTDEYYSRDVTGKEIAIYSSYTLQYWNVWSSSEIVGRVNPSEGEPRYYYLKDHLGSIRVVFDNSKTVISANDGVYPDLIGNLWGYFLQNRTYISTNTKNKFTGKERDNESSYDYFGARYYDARVGRWEGVEPLLEKYISYSPYQYAINNPVLLRDINGNILVLGGDKAQAELDIKSMFTEDIAKLISVNENGVVSFNINNSQLAEDAAIELLYNLVSSDRKFLYEVADKTEGIARENIGKITKGDIIDLNLDDFHGNSNLSITERNIDQGTGSKDILPKEGYSGQITLGTGKWTYPNTKKYFLPRSDIVFHELAENYFRTIEKQPYKRINGSGAHKSSVDYSKKYKKQTGNRPGEVGYYVR